MNAAASEHSHMTAAAISSGVPIRPTGSWAITAAFESATGEALHHLGVDDPGTDGVDAHVAVGVVERRRLGQADHAVLGGRVRGLAAEASNAGARGGVHERTAALLEHERDLVLHAQEHAAKADPDDAVPFGLADLGDRLDGLFDAGVVEGQIEPPELVDGRLKRRLHILRTRHVARDRESPSAGFFDQTGRFLVARVRDVGDHDAGALTREGQRGGAADAARRARDERHLASEARSGLLCVVHVGHGRRSTLIASRWSMA
jgi:hypothetical protein